MEMIKKLTVDDVCVRLYTQDEDQTPYESQIHAGIEEAKKFAQAVASTRLVSVWWGWCVVVVHVTWGQLEAKQYLGGCSYESADDFRDNSGYYDDMVKEALAEINSDIQSILTDLRKKGCI